MHLKNKTNLALVFLWSFLINCSLGSLNPIYIIINILLLFVLNRFSLKLTACVILLFSTIAVILFPIVANFGKPNINMVTALLYANDEEVFTTLNSLHPGWLVLGILTLLLGIFIVKQLKKLPVLGVKTTWVFAAIILVAILGRPFFTEQERGFADEIKYPPFKSLKKIYDSVELIKNTNQMIALGAITPTDFAKTTINKSPYDTFIMVIDESVRRDYMQVYGAPFNNTPFLSSSPGIFFDNYVSAGFSTVPSLTRSLLRINGDRLEYNNSVIQLAKNAGLKTFWLSNQGFYGFYDAPAAVIGTQADYTYFTKKGNSQLETYMPDSVLLPEINKALTEKRGKLVIIHLIGSHPDFCKRVDKQVEFRLHDKAHSCYAQSIKNTDRLLNEITTIATASGDKWSMLYFADHGLSHSPATGELLHRDRAKQNYSPPFVIINYDSKVKSHITALRSGVDFQKMFSQWIGVNEPLLQRTCDYFSQSLCLTRAKVLDGNMNWQEYDALANDPPRY